jgi:hypothetical protein
VISLDLLEQSVEVRQLADVRGDGGRLVADLCSCLIELMMTVAPCSANS